MNNKQKCTKCNQVKSMTEEYYHKKNSPTGFNTVCKECKKAYYEANREKKLEYQRAYLKENKDYYLAYGKAHCKGEKITKAEFEKAIRWQVPEEKKIINIKDYVETKDGRKFTRLVGGFGEGKTIITIKQIAKLLNSQDKVINQTINRNIGSFQYDTDIIDLKKNNSVTLSDRDLETIGYSKQSISNSKNIYILSESGFLLYLKFAEGERAVELYKDFIEDYFKTKVELKVAEVTLEKNITTLEDTKALLLGKVMMSSNEQDKMNMLMQIEKINNQLQENKITLAKEETIKQFQDIIEIGNKFTNSKECYDIGLFSKILGIKNLGRNNMFKWMRENKILMDNNEPYQAKMDYFKVIKVTKGNMTTSKTVLKATGIKYIVNKLIKDGYIKEKTYDEVLVVLNDLQAEQIA